MAIKLADTARPNNHVDAEHLGTFPVAYAEDVWFADGTRLSEKTFDGQSIQKEELPLASADELGNIYQYVGETGTYTKGYFYECVSDGGVTPTYSWKEINGGEVPVEYMDILPVGENIKDKFYVASATGEQAITFSKELDVYNSNIETLEGIGLVKKEDVIVNNTRRVLFETPDDAVYTIRYDSSYEEFILLEYDLTGLNASDGNKRYNLLIKRPDGTIIANYQSVSGRETMPIRWVGVEKLYLGNHESESLRRVAYLDETSKTVDAIIDTDEVPTTDIKNTFYRISNEIYLDYTSNKTYAEITADTLKITNVLDRAGITYNVEASEQYATNHIIISDSNELFLDIEKLVSDMYPSQPDKYSQYIGHYIQKISLEADKIEINFDNLNPSTYVTFSEKYNFRLFVASMPDEQIFMGDEKNNKVKELYNINIFTGTQAEWDALTVEQKKTYDQVNITDDESSTEGIKEYIRKWNELEPVPSVRIGNGIIGWTQGDLTQDYTMEHDGIVNVFLDENTHYYVVTDLSGSTTQIYAPTVHGSASSAMSLFLKKGYKIRLSTNSYSGLSIQYYVNRD